MAHFEQLNIHGYKNLKITSTQHVRLFECTESSAQGTFWINQIVLMTSLALVVNAR
jgi:hypothetical protein